MCKLGGEFVNHLLMYCNVAQELWNMVFILFRVQWVMPRDVVDLFSCWSCKFGRSETIVIERLFHIVSCGVYEVKGTLELSLGRRNQYHLQNSFSYRLFSTG